MNATDLPARVRTALAASRANVDAVLALPAEAQLGDVVRAADGILRPLNGVAGSVGLLSHVHPEEDVRTRCEGLEQEIAAFATELSLHRGLYDRLAALEPADAPDDETRRRLEHALRDFRRSGVDKDDATRDRIRALQAELVETGQDFDRNIVLGGGTFTIADGHAGLAGLPPDFIAAHPENEDGAVELSTDPGDRLAFLTFAERSDLREDYFVLTANRAVPENLEVLPRLLAKRHELAQLLGYSDWASFVTEDKMTGSADAARTFLERVIELVRPRSEQEYEELKASKLALEPDADTVHDWDRAFLVERQKAERYGVDAQEIRPYFAYANVKRGVFETSTRLYGVEFRRDEQAELWHAAVERWEVVDDGRVVAAFYLDMHPRDGKFKHAAMFHVAQGMLEGELPEAALVCNFPEPKGDDPALLLHDQVTTFFHEFGHLLHHLFAGGQRFLAFSGIATEADFVEVPSQMYEEWAWDPDVLATFATHVETGAPIPADLVRRMREADEYGKGLAVLQQMFYAQLSLTYYDRDPSTLDLTETMIELKRALLPTPYAEGTYFMASFGHLHGYSAMYYTYMWSLVIAKDVYSRFEADPMDTSVAREYRDKVLGRGGAKDAAELVADFLGREYSYDAFERWLRA